MKHGKNNSITDVGGIRVGNAQNKKIKSGVTVVVADTPNVASCHIAGGAPGTRETDLLQPENIVQSVDAVVLSGGSAFGLDAATGTQDALREMGRGYDVGGHKVPIVPAAILFDLLGGGDKKWKTNPYKKMGYEATMNATKKFGMGTQGAGYGATTGGPNGGLMGGLGSASTKANGFTVGAVVAVNALGSPVVGNSKKFRSAQFEINGEFGNTKNIKVSEEDPKKILTKNMRGSPNNKNTTIAVVATDAKLSKSECKRFAIAAHDGFANALFPAHTPFDGDAIFSIATGNTKKSLSPQQTIELTAVATSTVARAIARAIFLAKPQKNNPFGCWSQLS